MGVHGLLTIWRASCSAQPLLRFWYGNSREFCPKPHRRSDSRGGSGKMRQMGTKPRRRAAAAARSRSSRKPHPAWYAVLCAARAAPSPQGRAMAGQGRSPCGLGGSKGGHSSAKNGSLCEPCRPRHSPRGSAQSGFSFAKRPSLAGRQRASALLICRAALGTLL